MTVPAQNLADHIRGDSYSFPVIFQTSGQRQDMTGWVLWFTVKHHPLQADEDAAVQKQVTITGTSAVITLQAADTGHLPPVNFHYDLQLVSPNGDAVVTLVYGRWRLKQDVTHSTRESME